MLLPSFHGEKLAMQKAAMERVSEEVVAKFPVGKPFALREQMQEIALEVIMEVVLGLDSSGAQHDFLSRSTAELLDWIGAPWRLVATGVLGPKHPIITRMFGPKLAPLDAGIYELIAQRRQAADLDERSDILSMMLLATDEDGNGMTDAEVRDEIVTLIVAGHETTSTALAWAFERLTRDPEALKRLEDESRTDQTEWSDAVAKEALRLRPVLDFVVRRVGEPIEIAGYRFEPGEFVAPAIKLVHLREDIYPDATAFKPERWLDTKPGTYTWIPFGGGVRRCIGFSFAMAEMDVVMRAVARNVHLEPVGDEERVVSRFITSSPARGGEVLVPA
jgi:cytochrome P450